MQHCNSYLQPGGQGAWRHRHYRSYQDGVFQSCSCNGPYGQGFEQLFDKALRIINEADNAASIIYIRGEIVKENEKNKEPVVNEEYEDQEQTDKCCSETGDPAGEDRSCCSKEEESSHQCNCNDNSEVEELKKQ